MWKGSSCLWLQSKRDGEELWVTSVHGDSLAAPAFHAHIGWEFPAPWTRDVLRDGDSGCHAQRGDRREDMSHPSSQSRRASYLSRRLIWVWLISSRKSDGGMQEIMFLQKRGFKAREMRKDISQKDLRFWKGNMNSVSMSVISASPNRLSFHECHTGLIYSEVIPVISLVQYVQKAEPSSGSHLKMEEEISPAVLPLSSRCSRQRNGVTWLCYYHDLDTGRGANGKKICHDLEKVIYCLQSHSSSTKQHLFIFSLNHMDILRV